MPDIDEHTSRRRFLTATGSAATAVALAGCSGSDRPEDAQNTTETTAESEETETETTSETDSGDGGTLRLLSPNLDSLDPVKSIFASSGEILGNVFEGLVVLPNGNITVETALAESYDVSNGGRTYTFELKEGVSFHDGREVTAQDLEYAWERLAASDNSRRGHFLFDYLQVRHETETVTEDGEEQEVYEAGTLAANAVDDYTFEVTLEQPYYAALEIMSYPAFAAVPEGVVGDIEGYEGEMSHEEFATENPIGAGPFVLERWEKSTEARASRFDDYHGDVPNVAAVHWNITEDTNASYNYAMNTNADAFTLPTSQYDSSNVSVERTDDAGRKFGTYGPLRNGETANYQAVAGLSVDYLVFNTDRVEKPVRQAFAYLMNQQSLVGEVFKGRAEAGYHMTPPAIFPGGPDGYAEHAESNYPYGYDETRIEEAKSKMEEAGYGENNRKEMALTVWNSSAMESMAKLLRDLATAAYIDLEVKVQPFSAYMNRSRKGNFDSYLSGWRLSVADPAIVLAILYPPNTQISSDSKIEYANWKGTDAAERASDAWTAVKDHPRATEAHREARQEAFVEMEEANWEDVAHLPVRHGIYELFWYDWLDLPPFGPAGPENYRYDDATLDVDARPE